MVIIRPDVALQLVNSDRKSFYKLQTFFCSLWEFFLGTCHQQPSDLITDTERQHPDSLLIILGDLSRANLTQELAKHQQNIKFSTGDTFRLNLFLNMDE